MTWFALTLPLIALALGFTLWPYAGVRRRADASRLEPDLAYDPLLERKEVVLRNILDLEFEHRMGKLSDADYAAARGDLEEEAAAILDQLAAGAAPTPAGAKPPAVCGACSAANPAGNRFCGACGASLEKPR
ncbi:zinc ribbon domain-containing protein [bacterium]|nr:zinc ribbon domain-containing protein [bacterium]